jgi:hypothetical protein
MWRAYTDPRGAMAGQVAQGLSEPRALFHLVLACGLFFLASVPNALRTAQGLGIEDRVSAAVAAHLFAFVVVAPLLFYGLAALVHLIARGFGARGSFLAARAALFWTLLLGTPLALALALAGVVAEAVPVVLPWVAWLGYAGLAFWLWLFAAGVAEAEGFVATLLVAAVLVAVFAAAAAVLRVLAGGAAAAT